MTATFYGSHIKLIDKLYFGRRYTKSYLLVRCQGVEAKNRLHDDKKVTVCSNAVHIQMGFVNFTEDEFAEMFDVFRFGEFQSEAVNLKCFTII